MEPEAILQRRLIRREASGAGLGSVVPCSHRRRHLGGLDFFPLTVPRVREAIRRPAAPFLEDKEGLRGRECRVQGGSWCRLRRRRKLFDRCRVLYGGRRSS